MGLEDRITGSTKLIGIIGNPIEHTKSPLLHNSLSEMLGLNVIYVPLLTYRESLGDAVNGLKACNFLGFNVTIPFKEEVLKYTNNSTDDVKLMGCANTIKINDGEISAYNTDAEGFLRSFKEQAETGFNKKSVVILGAGGAARALAVKIALEDPEKLYIINRTVENANEIAEIINTKIARIAEPLSLKDAESDKIIEKCDIILNTTPVGMCPNIDESPLKDDIRLNSKQIIYDLIYNPAETKLIKQAKSFGCKAINGLGMLFYQGILAYEIWMNIKIPQTIINKLYKEFFDNILREI